jgi:hypothetical protein
MSSIREWLETLMQVSNEQEEAESVRQELSATIQDVLAIQAPSFDPWTEPLLTFEVSKLERRQ